MQLWKHCIHGRPSLAKHRPDIRYSAAVGRHRTTLSAVSRHFAFPGVPGHLPPAEVTRTTHGNARRSPRSQPADHRRAGCSHLQAAVAPYATPFTPHLSHHGSDQHPAPPKRPACRLLRNPPCPQWVDPAGAASLIPARPRLLGDQTEAGASPELRRRALMLATSHYLRGSSNEGDARSWMNATGDPSLPPLEANRRIVIHSAMKQAATG